MGKNDYSDIGTGLCEEQQRTLCKFSLYRFKPGLKMYKHKRKDKILILLVTRNNRTTCITQKAGTLLQ